MTRTRPSGAAFRKAEPTEKTAPQGLARVKAKDQNGLIPLHRALVEAYCGEANFDLLKAAQIVNLHPSQPRHKILKQAERILARPEVRALVQAWFESDPLVATRQERLRFLSNVMRGTELSDGTPPTMAERLKAADYLGRAQGDAVNLTLTINPDHMSAAELEAAMLALGVDVARLGEGVIDTVGEPAGREEDADDILEP